MASPVSRDALRKRKASRERSNPAGHALEDQLDSLLEPPKNRQGAGADNETQEAEPSPIEQLRTLFVEDIIPTISLLNDRYCEKGITVQIDAADFLNNGRSLFIDVEYGNHKMRLEGTVLADKIAFCETRQMNDMGGTVAAGPMIRTRNLTGKTFSNFVYKRIIALVKDANR